jgi:alpha-amylase
VLATKNLSFATPTEIAENFQPVSAVSASYPISWADEERALTAWLGNEMQKEPFEILYRLKDQMQKCTDKDLLKDWNYLQVSNHFYYMCTKFFSDGDVHSYFTPYSSPYDAFINYMNVLSDFKMRVQQCMADREEDNTIKQQKVLSEKDDLIKRYEREIKKLKKQILEV